MVRPVKAVHRVVQGVRVVQPAQVVQIVAAHHVQVDAQADARAVRAVRLDAQAVHRAVLKTVAVVAHHVQRVHPAQAVRAVRAVRHAVVDVSERVRAVADMAVSMVAHRVQRIAKSIVRRTAETNVRPFVLTAVQGAMDAERHANKRVHQRVQKPAPAVHRVQVVPVVHRHVAVVPVARHAAETVRQAVAAVRGVPVAHQVVKAVREIVKHHAPALVIAVVQDARPLVQAHVMTLAQRQTRHRLSRTLAVISALATL